MEFAQTKNIVEAADEYITTNNASTKKAEFDKECSKGIMIIDKANDVNDQINEMKNNFGK